MQATLTADGICSVIVAAVAGDRRSEVVVDVRLLRSQAIEVQTAQPHAAPAVDVDVVVACNEELLGLARIAAAAIHPVLPVRVHVLDANTADALAALCGPPAAVNHNVTHFEQWPAIAFVLAVAVASVSAGVPVAPADLHTMAV